MASTHRKDETGSTIFAVLIYIAILLQLVTFGRLIPEKDPSLGIAAVWCVVSGLLTVGLGEAIFKTLARWLMTRKWNQRTLARYRHWGMEAQVLRRPYRWVDWAIVLPFYASHLSATYFLAVPVAMNTAPFRDHPSNLITIWLDRAAHTIPVAISRIFFPQDENGTARCPASRLFTPGSV